MTFTVVVQIFKIYQTHARKWIFKNQPRVSACPTTPVYLRQRTAGPVSALRLTARGFSRTGRRFIALAVHGQ